MNYLIENGLMSELPCGSNFSYILNDPLLFSGTDYRILQSNESGPLVKCMKVLLNGQIQLYYMTTGLRPFSSFLNQIDGDTFVSMVGNIIYSINKVKSNGFFRVHNLDLSFEHIFVDPVTMNVYLLYLPLVNSLYQDVGMAENEFRSSLMRLIYGMETIASPKTMQLYNNLQNVSIPFENICDSIGNAPPVQPGDEPAAEPEEEDGPSMPLLKLTAINLSGNPAFVVDRNPYIIGRSKQYADGLIRDDLKMIGRTHCRILSDVNGFWVEDMTSANGTFINNQRLAAGVPIRILDGDILKLATIEFEAQII